MSFDEEPDGDPHGECAAEIRQLQSECAALRAERDRAVELLREAAMNGNQTYRDRINGDIDAFLASLQETPK